MNNTSFLKSLIISCMLTWAIMAMAQQTTYKPDSRYICPANGAMTQLARPDYDYNNHTFYICTSDGKVGVVDERKLVVIPIEYDEIKRINSNYCLIRKDDKWGVITQYGEFVLPPVLESVSYSSAGFTLSDGDGSPITVEDDLLHFDSDLRKVAALLSMHFKWGNAFVLRMDNTTKAIPMDEFWTSSEFHDGLMPVWDKNSKKLGYLNTKGEWAIPISIPQDRMFNENFAFSGGYLVLEHAGRYKIYNQKGQVLWSQVFEAGNSKYTLSDYVEGGYALLCIQSANRTQWKYVSSNGTQMFPDVFGTKTYQMPYGRINEFVRPMCDEMVAFPDFSTSEHRWGFFDKNGKVIARGKYANVHDFQEGLAAVQMPEGGENPNKWGFIDKTGNMVIPARFSNEPGDFSEGLAVVTKTNGLKVYINKNGEVVSPEYSNAQPFVNGIAFMEVYNGYTSEYYALDHSFNVVNFLLPSQLFTPETRAQILETAKNPNRPAGDVFYYPAYNLSQLVNSRGDLYFVWCNNIMTINSITDGVVHVSYGEQQGEFYCDTTGKILFYMTRNEF